MTRLVDLFAGFGGTSHGAKLAGVTVVAAANHWPLAVAAHELNHPATRHYCQDIRQMDWAELPDHDGLWASPSCQVYSSANARKAGSRVNGDRATAWAVVDCADVTAPRFLVVENVPEFRMWRLYPEWKAALAKLGYHLSEHLIRASHHGVPRRRDRLFVVGTRSGHEPYFARSMTEPAFGPCIDWSSGEWRDVAATSESVRARIATAQRNHGRRCLSQHVTRHPGASLDEPIRTITTATLRRGDRSREVDEFLAQNARAGNSVCPDVARALVAANLVRIAEAA